jgi:hypothetical protein
MAQVGYYVLKPVQFHTQVDYDGSHFIQLVIYNIAEFYDLHCFESYAEHLEFINSLLAENKYLVRIAQHMKSGVHCPNPTQTVSKAANKYRESTFVPGVTNCGLCSDQIVSSHKYPV